jgi:hypothetical protein
MRRSISIPGDLYWEVRRYCDQVGKPMSQLTEMLLKDFLKNKGHAVQEEEVSADKPSEYRDAKPVGYRPLVSAPERGAKPPAVGDKEVDYKKMPPLRPAGGRTTMF